jgi:patatin-like phospholipase/acyl hydrolase
MATSAAPSYFPPFKFSDNCKIDKKFLDARYVDGGIIANNPSMIAHVEACKSERVKNPKHDILHVSLSTGYEFNIKKVKPSIDG